MPDREWLAGLVREWHLLADTSFSDLLLWVPSDPGTFSVIAQERPSTGPTVLEDDRVGTTIRDDPDNVVVRAYDTHEIVAYGNVWAVPIMRSGVCVGIVERHTSQSGLRAPGMLEDTYLEVAGVLTNMLWHGIFPVEPRSVASVSPKVGDGVVRADEQGVVVYASPNAVSAHRRLGLVTDLVGVSLDRLTEVLGVSAHEVARGPKDETGRRVRELTIDAPQASVRLRVLPLTMEGAQAGSVTLCVDTTALRERERELVTKDATIREIHHRVKNNLQTVAALLRLQSRRVGAPEARAALKEAVSRVQAIAVVHEILSQTYDETVHFDGLADQLLAMVGDMAVTSGTVHSTREGSFGLVPADAATALSLILTELCQNAVEHGLGASSGTLIVRAARDGDTLSFAVINDGTPLPPGFDVTASNSLGLSIVRTLVDDQGGFFTLDNNPDGQGATARVVVRLGALSR